MEEATGIRRRLAKANPTANQPDLAMSLNNLGTALSELGRRDEALTAAEEATSIYRRLAKANPAAYQPDLAMSLWRYAAACVNVKEKLPEAWQTITEAIRLYQPLTKQLPQRFAVQLWKAYRTLADVLEGLGRTEEATNLRRQLDQARGNRHE